MNEADEPKRSAPPQERSDEGDGAFLRRWSRRKHEARAAAATAPVAQAPEPTPPEKLLTDADMPPIETLSETSDFSVFLSPGVSEELRRRALRKLFTLPGINQRCPLDSEWYDCRGDEPLGDVITHEMREELERAAEKLKQTATDMLREGEPPAASAGSGTPPAADPGAAPPAGSTTAEASQEHWHRRVTEGTDT